MDLSRPLSDEDLQRVAEWLASLVRGQPMVGLESDRRAIRYSIASLVALPDSASFVAYPTARAELFTPDVFWLRDGRGVAEALLRHIRLLERIIADQAEESLAVRQCQQLRQALLPFAFPEKVGQLNMVDMHHAREALLGIK